MSPAWSQACICGQTFSVLQAYTCHLHSCPNTKKWLSSALQKAEVVFQVKKHCETEGAVQQETSTDFLWPVTAYLMVGNSKPNLLPLSSFIKIQTRPSSTWHCESLSSSFISFSAGWYVTYPMTQPGVRLVFSLLFIRWLGYNAIPLGQLQRDAVLPQWPTQTTSIWCASAKAWWPHVHTTVKALVWLQRRQQCF